MAEREMDVEVIRARVEKATMWTPDQCEMKVDPDDGYVFAPQGATIGDTLIQLGDTYDGSGDDWVFIAHARTDIPALLDEVSRLREALADALRVARYESDVAEQAIQAMQSSPSIAPTGKPVDE
jgi:hypothetical protein